MTKARSQQKQILQLAKAGNPKVIASFLNHKLKQQEIQVKVRWENRTLNVAIASHTVPDRQFSLDIIERGLKRLDIHGLAAIEVCAYQTSAPEPSWTQQIPIEKNQIAIDLAAWLESGTSLDNAVVDLSTVGHSPDPQPPTPPPTPDPEQRYLCFQIGLDQKAMLPVESIQEILRFQAVQILAVPDLPIVILGLYNWRGEMLWLLDLNLLLGIGRIDDFGTSQLTAIVLKCDRHSIGLVVQQVEEIESYNPQNLQPPNRLFDPHLEPFITGYFSDVHRIVLNPLAIFQAILF